MALPVKFNRGQPSQGVVLRNTVVTESPDALPASAADSGSNSPDASAAPSRTAPVTSGRTSTKFTYIAGEQMIPTDQFTALPKRYQDVLISGGIAAFNKLAKQENDQAMKNWKAEVAARIQADAESNIQSPTPDLLSGPSSDSLTQQATAAALSTMRTTAPELFNADGSLNIPAAIARGIDPQFIVNSGGGTVDSVNTAITQANADRKAQILHNQEAARNTIETLRITAPDLWDANGTFQPDKALEKGIPAQLLIDSGQVTVPQIQQVISDYNTAVSKQQADIAFRQESTAQALVTMKQTAPELFDTQGNLILDKALARGIDPQFIVDSGAIPHATVVKYLDDQAADLKTNYTKLPDGQYIKNTDLSELSPELRDVALTQGYDALLSGIKAAEMAWVASLPEKYQDIYNQKIPEGFVGPIQAPADRVNAAIQADNAALPVTPSLGRLRYLAQHGETGIKQSATGVLATPSFDAELQNHAVLPPGIIQMGVKAIADYMKSPDYDLPGFLAAVGNTEAAKSYLSSKGFTPEAVNSASRTVIALGVLGKYKSSSGDYNIIDIRADLRAGRLNPDIILQSGLNLRSGADVALTSQVVDSEAATGRFGFESWRTSSRDAKINPNELVDAARLSGIIKPWDNLTNAEKQSGDFERTGPNEVAPANIGSWWLGLNDADKSKILSFYRTSGFTESFTQELANSNSELSRALNTAPQSKGVRSVANGIELAYSAATTAAALYALGIPLIIGSMVEQRGDVRSVAKGLVTGVGDTVEVLWHGPQSVSPSTYGAAVGTAVVMIKPTVGLLKFGADLAKGGLRTVLYVVSKDGVLPRALKTPGNATYKYKDPRTGKIVTLQGNEWDVYRIPIPDNLTAVKMERLVGQAQKLSIDTGKDVEIVSKDGSLVRKISPAGQVIANTLYHADPNMVRMLNQSAGRGGMTTRGTAVVTDSKGRILLTRIKGRTTYDLPGGEVDLSLGELPVEGMFRELKEEVNLNPKRARYVGSFVDSERGKFTPRQYHVYEATYSGTPKVSAELTEIKWWDGKSKLDYPLTEFSRKAIDAYKKSPTGSMEFSFARRLAQQKLNKDWELLPERYKANELHPGALAAERSRSGLDAPAREHYINLSKTFYYSPDVAFDFARGSLKAGDKPVSPGIIALKLSQKDIDMISPGLRSKALSTPVKQWMAAVEDELTQKGVKIYDTGVETKTWYPGETESIGGVKISKGQRMPVRWFVTENAMKEAVKPPSSGQLQAANLLALQSSLADIAYLRLRRISFSRDSAGVARSLLRVDREVYKYDKPAIDKLARDLKEKGDFAKRFSAEMKQIGKLSAEERRAMTEYYYVNLYTLLRSVAAAEKRSAVDGVVMPQGEVVVPLESEARDRAASGGSAIARSSSYPNREVQDVRTMVGRVMGPGRIAIDGATELRASIPDDRVSEAVLANFRPVELSGTITERLMGARGGPLVPLRPVETITGRPPEKEGGVPSIERIPPPNERIPPPDERKPPVTPAVPPSYGTSISVGAIAREAKRLAFQDSIGWQQGFGVWAAKEPYTSRSDFAFFHEKGPMPRGIKLVPGGAKEAYRSIQALTGADPPKDAKLNMGIMRVEIKSPSTTPGKAGSISFTRIADPVGINRVASGSTHSVIPAGSLAWRGEDLFWYYLPAGKWDLGSPIQLSRPPMGAENLSGTTPAETLQIVGRSRASPALSNMTINLPEADIVVSDKGKSLSYEPKGMLAESGFGGVPVMAGGLSRVDFDAAASRTGPRGRIKMKNLGGSKIKSKRSGAKSVSVSGIMHTRPGVLSETTGA